MAGYTSLAPTNAAATNAGLFSGLAGLLGGGSSGSGTTPNMLGAQSDRRLKRNIKYIGNTPSGIPVYEFSYVFDDNIHIGCMGDEVLEVIPEAVYKDNTGFLMVNYDMVH